MKSVRIGSYSGPYFATCGLNTEGYRVSLRIQSECGKIRTRITPNMDTFYAVSINIAIIIIVVFRKIMNVIVNYKVNQCIT